MPVPLRLLGLCAAAALTLGCQGKPAVQFPSARAALERLDQQNSCSQAVQGEANLAFSGDGRRLNGSVLFLAQKPENLRLDVFSSFGATLSTLTSDGTKFGLYSLQEKTFLHGPASACNVRRFTQVPVAPRALVDLFRGLPPLIEAQKTSIRYDAPLFGAGAYFLEFDGGKGRQEIRLGVHPDDFEQPLGKQRLRLLEVVTKSGGDVLYEVALKGHAVAENAVITQSAEERAMGLEPPQPSGPACHAELPRDLRFFVPKNGYQLTFKTKEVWHNPPLGPESFQQPTPSGVVVQESSCVD